MAGDGQGAPGTAESVARRSYGRLVAYVAARTRDVAQAEDALSEAFASALATWPSHGVPDNPEAWLLTAARRKIIDGARRRQTREAAATHLALIAEELEAADEAAEIPDRRLALLFACAHPAIEAGIRAPLMLQAVLGLDAAMIASAFLTSPAAMGKRLVRAKAKIREAGIPFAVPERSELPARLQTVLDAIYAAFAEGWSDPGGTDVARRDLTGEALFLARLAVELMPSEPEALGLLALVLYIDSRRSARRDTSGAFLAFAEQDVADWDSTMIAEAEFLLGRAAGFGAAGRYQIEAALQSAHVARRRTGRADWHAVVMLYDALLLLTGSSPVVGLNRALAIAERGGPQAGLAALEAIADSRLDRYQPYWAARAELASRLGATADARRAYDLAIGLEHDPAVRAFLARRRAAAG